MKTLQNLAQLADFHLSEVLSKQILYRPMTMSVFFDIIDVVHGHLYVSQT